LGVLDRHLLALSEICKELENLIEEIKEPNSEILKKIIESLKHFKILAFRVPKQLELRQH